MGVDIGGTLIKAVALAGQAPGAGRARVPEIVEEQVLPTPLDVAQRLGEVVEGVVERLLPGGHSEGAMVGVAVPGLVDERRGMACYSANPGRAVAEAGSGPPGGAGARRARRPGG